MPDITIAVKDTYDGSQLSRLKQDLRGVLALQRQLATTSHGMPQTGAVGAAAVANGRLSNAPAPGGSPVSPVSTVNAQVAAAGGAARLAAQQQANISPTLPQQMQAQQGYGGGNNYYPQMIVGGVLKGAGDALLGQTSENLGAYGRAQLTGVAVNALEGQEAPRVIAEAREQAKDTFGASYQDILRFQNQLVNVGETREQSQSMVKNLADVNAAMGGTSDRLMRIMYNLSQVESQSRLTGRDLRDFEVNLVPMTRYLAQSQGLTMSQVRDKVSEGGITSAMVRGAVEAMGNDPKFKDRGKIITETTLPGQFEKTREEFEELRELMGEGLAPTVQKVNVGLRAAIELMKNNPALAKGAGLATGVAGVGLAATGGAVLSVAGLRLLGQAIPFLQSGKMTGPRSVLFGTNFVRGATPMNPLFVMPVGGGLGGGLSGATGAAARAGAAGAGAAGAGAARVAGLTVRGALGAGALGVVGAVQQHGDMKAIGASGGEAFAAAATVGIGEGLIAAFVPGGAVAVAIAEGLRFGVNELYNKPMENAPENNPDAPLNPASDSKKSFAERAELYQSQAGEMAARRNELAEPGMLEKGLSFFDGGVGFSAALKASREAAADNEGAGVLDSRMAAANAAGMRRRINREQNPDQATRSRRAEDEFRANPLNFNQGPGLLVTNAKNIEVGKVGNNSDGTQTILLTIPMHPRTERMVNGLEQATRN